MNEHPKRKVVVSKVILFFFFFFFMDVDRVQMNVKCPAVEAAELTGHWKWVATYPTCEGAKSTTVQVQAKRDLLRPTKIFSWYHRKTPSIRTSMGRLSWLEISADTCKPRTEGEWPDENTVLRDRNKKAKRNGWWTQGPRYFEHGQILHREPVRTQMDSGEKNLNVASTSTVAVLSQLLS